MGNKEMMDVEAQTRKTNDGTDSFSIFKNANLPVTLKFDNVVYTIKPKPTRGWCNFKAKTQEEKTILKGLTGIVKPGEMLAMLGPSGSGKTTLLTALGGRLGVGELTGEISYNDMPFSKVVKRNTGFVTQDDVLYPHLTVTETLVFTALLRLPNSMTRQEKIKQAEAVMAQLGLTRCKNSIIGGQFMRGVSGGERKRVSIGQEILINPSLLFLDEPTSGLDSTTAQRIISVVWELTKGGRTVVMTIHQPSSRLFYMFDKLLLLSEGKPLYYGPGSSVMEYFASVGYSPSMAMNPSDFLLDIANGMATDESKSQESIKAALATAYEMNLADSLHSEIQEKCSYSFQSSEDLEGNKNFVEWPTTWWQQFAVLLKRGLKERRHESFSGLRVGQILVVALLSGLLWWKSDISHLQDQIGFLFFYASFWGSLPLFQAIFTFPQERRMLEKERSSGMYRLSSYFMSRVVADLPMELVLPTVFVIITYWMAGLNPNPAVFFITLLGTLFNVLVSDGLGLAIGALVMDLKSATTLASVIVLVFLLVGGFYVQHVPPFISWVRYISITTYAYKLLVVAQYKADETYSCGEGGRSVCYVGDFAAIKNIGLDGESASALALFVMLVGYRLVAYVALTRVGKVKQR